MRPSFVLAASLVPLVLGGCLGTDVPPYTGELYEDCTFASSGRNDYFILEPGWVLRLEGEDEGERLLLMITVTNETRVVDGTTTRVVIEDETTDGETVERSRNFFAYCQETGSMFYFGEEVDDYEHGELVGHSGEWLAGQDGARAGVMMPGDPRVGLRHFQEYSPGQAMDEAEVVALDETVTTPAGTFANALKVKETTTLERGHVEHKWYAPGIGVAVDEGLRLVSYGFQDA